MSSKISGVVSKECGFENAKATEFSLGHLQVAVTLNVQPQIEVVCFNVQSGEF